VSKADGEVSQSMAAFLSSSMQTSSIGRVVCWARLCSVWLCVGCGATGLDWVAEAHLESARLQRVNSVQEIRSREAAPGSIPATAEQNATDSRPRLNRTVTLGEIDVVASRVGAAASPVAGPSLNVYNYNQVNVVAPGFGYANYGYFRGSPGFLPGGVTVAPARSNASGPLPGQNWPAVADHGPSFPYLASPASPWTRTQ
jgi:hypothetical protein